MKANVKKFMAVIAATAMCAVPMAGSMTANAAGSIESISDVRFTKGDMVNVSLSGKNLGKVKVENVVPFLIDKTFSKIDNINADYDFGEPGDWCGTPWPGMYKVKKWKLDYEELILKKLNSAQIKFGSRKTLPVEKFSIKRQSNGNIIFVNPMTNPPMITVIDPDGNIIYHGPESGYFGGKILGGTLKRPGKLTVSEAVMSTESIRDKLDTTALVKEGTLVKGMVSKNN